MSDPAGARREEVTRRARESDGRTFDEGAPSWTTRPALDVLQRDQERLLTEGDRRRDPAIVPLTDGFRTWYELVTWYQAAAVRTLGRVGDVIEPAKLLPQRSISDALLQKSDHDEYVRVRLVERLHEACNRAYASYRQRADERVSTGKSGDDGYDKVDAEAERAPGMRPAHRKLDEQQAARLQELWTGFDSRADLEKWLSRLSPATHGTHDEQLGENVATDPALRDALLDQDCYEGTAIRLRFAISELLPAFVSGAREIEGAEKVNKTADSNGWRQG